MIGNKDAGLETYYVNIKNIKNENDNPHFEFVEVKNKDNKIVETEVSGYLRNISFINEDYEGKAVRKCRIELVDPQVGQLYLIKSGFTFVFRNVLNNLLNIEDLGLIKMNIVGKKDDFKNIWITNDNNPVRWKHDPKELSKKTEKITNKKGEVISTDYTELNQFLEEEITKNLIPMLKQSQEQVKKDDFLGDGQGDTLIPESESDINNKPKKGKVVKDESLESSENPDDLPF